MTRKTRMWLKAASLVLAGGVVFQVGGCSSSAIVYQLGYYVLQLILSSALSGTSLST